MKDSSSIYLKYFFVYNLQRAQFIHALCCYVHVLELFIPYIVPDLIWFSFFKPPFFSIYLYYIIFIYLVNYIIVTLWVPSVTRYAFLMASTSLILIMFINYIFIANVFCIMWEIKTNKIELRKKKCCSILWKLFLS